MKGIWFHGYIAVENFFSILVVCYWASYGYTIFCPKYHWRQVLKLPEGYLPVELLLTHPTLCTLERSDLSVSLGKWVLLINCVRPGKEFLAFLKVSYYLVGLMTSRVFRRVNKHP